MKDRDRRKLQATLVLLAMVFVAVATALSITYIALGALIVYARKNFLVWNEKRKEENAQRKELGLEKKQGLLSKIKSKLGKDKSKDLGDESNDFGNVSSAGYNIKPVEFDKIEYEQEDSQIEVTGSDYLARYEEGFEETVDTISQDSVPRYDNFGRSNQIGTTNRFRGIKF